MTKIRCVPRAIAVITVMAIVAFVLILGASISIAYILTNQFSVTDLPAWVQAVGAILAIVAGFATIYYQRVAEASDQLEPQAINARVAFLIAVQAITTLGERLDAVLAPNRDTHPYRLRGNRAGEMIASLRELDTTRIPPNLLEKFLQLRSNLYALNERISEIYESEKPSKAAPRERSERPQRLAGGIEIWFSSRTLLDEIRATMTDAGHSNLAPAPRAFSFEEVTRLSYPLSSKSTAT